MKKIDACFEFNGQEIEVVFSITDSGHSYLCHEGVYLNSGAALSDKELDEIQSDYSHMLRGTP